jgi:PAS domain S-box-containing protein
VKPDDDEEPLLRSVAIQNATSILLARQRAEEELLQAKEALERKTRELAHSLALMRATLESTSDAMLVTDQHGNVTDVNQRFIDMWRLPGALMESRAHREILDHLGRQLEDPKRFLARTDEIYAASPQDSCDVLELADGRVFERYSKIQCVNERNVGRVWSFRDVTETRRALESERYARSEAEQASSMKDEFLATLSHELRTPLSAILGWAQILRARPVTKAELDQGLEVMERNARMQTQLIEDLLDIGRIRSGKMRLDVQPVDPVTFIDAALETVKLAAESKAIELHKRLDAAAGPITGDPNRLQQVIWNLLSNAIKFTGRHGRVDVLLARVESHVEVSVADTGVGIAPAFLPHVFDRFRPADPSHTRTAMGLGLGLSIVKHLVEAHGGTVRVSSPGLGGGATFTVSLPLTVAQRDREDGERGRPEKFGALASDFRRSDLSGIKVLVVDDQADACELLERVLSECAAEVLTARTADEAVRLVEAERPDVLVSDIGMPKVDGYELLRRVRALGQARGGRLPAIALTAFARSEDRTRALHAGFLAHVSKPVESSELVATVASVVGRTGQSGADERR